MPRRLLLEGSAIEPLLRQARAEHGQSARIVKAEKVRVGGVGGFFAKERYEVIVEVDDEVGAGKSAPAQDGADGAAGADGADGAAGAAGAQGAGPAAAGSPAPRGIAALLAAAEEAERGSASPPVITAGPSPSAAALAAVSEAMASREAARTAAPAVAPGPAVPAGRGFGDVLAALRAGDAARGAGGGADGADGDVRVPDDARSITEDLAIAAQDPDQAAALEAVRRALDALGIVDDTAEIAAASAAAAAEGSAATPAVAPSPAAPVAPRPAAPAAPSPDVPAFRPSVPERLEVDHPEDGLDDGLDDHPDGDPAEDGADVSAEAPTGTVQEPVRAEPPSVEEAVATLQELPSSLVLPPVAAGAAEPVDHPMTRRERRLAEAAAAAETTVDVLDAGTDVSDAGADVTADEPVDGAGPAPDDDTPDDLASDDLASDDASESSDRPGPAQRLQQDPLPPLPTTLAGLGEPEPGEVLPELPSVPAVLAVPTTSAVLAVPTPPSGDRPHPPAPAVSSGFDLGTVADRLERLGIDRRWLHDVPDDLSSALRQLARRLAASPPRPRRSVQAADNPLVAVLAEDAGGLETARTLAVGLGLRADEVTVVTSATTTGTRPRAGAAPHRRTGVPLDRAAAARVAHGGRRRSAPSVVLVPTSFAASPGERTAAAAVLASLDADQVWAVVDATRRTSDVEGWLRTVGPSSGVDAVALVGTGSTTAPAASLRLSAPVVLLDGRPATAVDWVVHLAAHLVREDLEDHLGPHDDDAAGGLDTASSAREPA